MNIYFYKGKENILNLSSPDPDEVKKDAITKIKTDLSKAFDTKGLSFLIGSGCSSFWVDDKEVGIPTMKPMASEFYTPNDDNIYCLTEEERDYIKQTLLIDIDGDSFKGNIERFLETLHSYMFYLNRINDDDDIVGVKSDDKAKLILIIKKTRLFILSKCLNETNNESDTPLVSLYETFYRKLLYRSPNLAKPSIFTTNYDLYSEKALDNIGVHYANGFSGGINKYFNPTIFNYAFAEKMDLSQSKWNVIDNFIYLYKIHGSVNWIEDESLNKLYRIREVQDVSFDNLQTKQNVMIYPSPAKQNASLGTPYSDLFREFQKKIMQNNNILITMGYSFSDEHINNLIYQALAIPSFRLITFSEINENIQKLIDLNDPRIWIIGGQLDADTNIHYFKQIVELLLPDLSNDEIDEKLEAVMKLIKQ